MAFCHAHLLSRPKSALRSLELGWKISKITSGDLAGIIFITTLPGVILGSFFSLNTSEYFIQLFLGIMAITLAILFVACQYNQSTLTSEDYNPKRLFIILPIPAFLGVIMGVLSTGISEWLIPLLTSRLKINMRQAIGTLVPVTFMLVLVASIIRGSLQPSILWEYVIFGGIGTLIGAQIGPQINKHFNDQILKEAFIYLMTLMGIHLIFQAL